MSMLALNCGKTLRAMPSTLMRIAVGVSLPPAASAFLPYAARHFSKLVMSALSNWVTCGIVAQACARRSAVISRTLVTG